MTTKASKNSVDYFQQHLVPIYFAFNNGQKSHVAVVTAFVMSLADQWLLVSAGHCIRDTETNSQTGHKITACRLKERCITWSWLTSAL